MHVLLVILSEHFLSVFLSICDFQLIRDRSNASSLGKTYSFYFNCSPPNLALKILIYAICLTLSKLNWCWNNADVVCICYTFVLSYGLKICCCSDRRTLLSPACCTVLVRLTLSWAVEGGSFRTYSSPSSDIAFMSCCNSDGFKDLSI